LRRVDLVDATVLLELLSVPGKPDHHAEILAELEERVNRGDIELRIPLATLVETGNHVSKIQQGGARRTCAERLERVVNKTLGGEVPWSFAPVSWDPELLRELVTPSDENAPQLVDSLARDYLQMGDLMILNEFRRLRASLDRRVADVDVWTLDQSLRAAVDALKA
jgi:hypothetical protein